MNRYSKILIVTDVNVSRYFDRAALRESLAGLPVDSCACEFIDLDISERKKTLDTVEDLIRILLERGADRKSLLVGVGGGVTTDVVGFTASVYMRGIAFAFLPTTLLAQVDAALGGKNGVDLDAYKNIIGCIRQPELVLRRSAFLKTLPKAEWRNGLAEMLKTFILFDVEAYHRTVSLFRQILRPEGEELSLKPEDLRAVGELVERCAEYKLAVVRRDERENGERRLLNLGHTFAHAIEKCSSAGIPHGQAVAVGMIYAARIATGNSEFSKKLKADFQSLGLRTSVDIDIAQLMSAVRKDKKGEGWQIHFIWPSDFEKVEDRLVSYDELEERTYALRQLE